MRRRFRASGMAGLGVAGALALVAGCWPFTEGADCATAFINCPTSTTGSSSSGGPDGGDGGRINCDPTMGAVDESCGVFVSASAPSGGTGTKTSPYNSLQTAITDASGKYVYACANTPFAEAVTIPAPVQLYGGFADCTTEAGWSWTQAARTALNGPADAVALTLAAGAEGTTVEGFAITAASPSDLTMGGSSIAVTVADLVATLDHCDVTASDGAAGVNGTTPTSTVMSGTSAPPPDPGTMNACVLPASVNGGAPGTTTCGGIDTSGGLGGKGGITGMPDGNGQKGADGSPSDMMNGLGGAGESTSKCVDGTTGHDGTAGTSGPGGSGSGDKLSLGGITNGDATDGQSGTPGQGGGGGGGAKAGTFLSAEREPGQRARRERWRRWRRRLRRPRRWRWEGRR